MHKLTPCRHVYDHDPLPSDEQRALDDMVERDFKHVLERMWDHEAPIAETAEPNRHVDTVDASKVILADVPRLRR